MFVYWNEVFKKILGDTEFHHCIKTSRTKRKERISDTKSENIKLFRVHYELFSVYDE